MDIAVDHEKVIRSSSLPNKQKPNAVFNTNSEWRAQEAKLQQIRPMTTASTTTVLSKLDHNTPINENNNSFNWQKLEFMLRCTSNAVASRYSANQHNFESEAKFYDVMLPRITSETPEYIWEDATGDTKFILAFSANPRIQLPEYKEVLLYDTSSVASYSHPLYPSEMRDRFLSSNTSVYIDICHKRLKRVKHFDENGVVESETYVLEYVEVLDACIGNIPALVGGQFCHAQRSGFMCDKNPDDADGYYYHDGAKKLIECHLAMRNNFAHTYFVDSDASTTNGSISKKDGYEDLIECDYRPANEHFQRTGAALHVYLKVPDAAGHKKRFEALKKERPSDKDWAIDVFAANTTTTHHNTIATTRDKYALKRTLLDTYESLDVSIQNLQLFNFNASAVFCMLGMTRKSDMVQTVCPFDITSKSLSQPQRILRNMAKRILYGHRILPSSRQQSSTILHSVRHDDKYAPLRLTIREHFKDCFDTDDTWIEDEEEEQVAARIKWSYTDMMCYYASLVAPKDVKKGLKDLLNSLQKEFLPNIGIDVSRVTLEAKQREFAFKIVLKILNVHAGLIDEDDIDDLNEKDVVTIGPMFTTKFRSAFKDDVTRLIDNINKMHKNHKNYSVKELLSRSSKMVKPIFDQNPFYSCMSTGTFDIVQNAPSFTGVVQIDDPTLSSHPCVAYEQRRKIRTKVHPHCKFIEPHEYHESHRGRLCVTHTPSDKSAGLLTHLAIGARVRIGYDVPWLMPSVLDVKRHGIIAHTGSRFGKSATPIGAVDVCINDCVVGHTFTPWETLMELRRSRLGTFMHLPFDVGITWVGGPFYRGGPLKHPYDNYININGNDGAILRPVFCTANLYKLEHLVACHLHSKKDLHDALVLEGVLAYLDPEEESESVIAESVRQLVEKEAFWLDTNSKMRRRALYTTHSRLAHYLYNPKSTTTTSRYNYAEHVKFTESVPLTLRHPLLGRAPYTHVAIAPEFSLGFLASTIPYYNHNNGTRDTFGSNMMSQDVGTMPLNYEFEKIRPTYSMLIPKQTLAPTLLNKHVGSYGGIASNREPIFELIMSHKHNGEDATARIMPQHMQHFAIKSFYFYAAIRSDASPKNVRAAKERMPFFGRPDKRTCLGMKTSDYSALNALGEPVVGRVIRPGAAIIGRLTNTMTPVVSNDTTTTEQFYTRDASDINTTDYAFIVRRVMRATSGTDAPVIHVICDTLLVPEVADKGSSPHGQKGVVAVFLSREDVPRVVFYRDGETIPEEMIAEMLMGPHALPSRQTSGQHHETAASIKTLMRRGYLNYDASPLTPTVIDPSVPDEFDVYNTNTTGCKLETKISGGWGDYAALIHYATTKVNNRVRGAVDNRTRQPVGSKQAGGGGRFGYMELACLNGAGVVNLINETMFANSDPAEYFLCRTTGLFVTTRVETPDNPGLFLCPNCGKYGCIVRIMLPSTLHLMITECYAAGIGLRLRLKDTSSSSQNKLITNEAVFMNTSSTSVIHSQPQDAYPTTTTTTLPSIYEDENGDVFIMAV
jgi:DNA-directed RNA polymerase beta subunit